MSEGQTADYPLVHELLRDAALRDPNRPWVRFIEEDREWTYGELYSQVCRVTAGLRAIDVRTGDRVALWISNRSEYVEAWFACHNAGAVTVPLNTELRGAILEHMLRVVEPKVIIAEAQALDRLLAAAKALDITPRFVVIDDIGTGKEPAGVPSTSPIVSLDAVPYDELRQHGAEHGVSIPSDSAACILFTSGTTGPSKGCIWTHRGSVHTAFLAASNLAITRADVMYTCLPLFHGNAMHSTMLTSLFSGARLAVATRFSASRYWTHINDTRATVTTMIGSLAPILLQREPCEDERRHSLRLALVMPAPPDYYRLIPDRFGIRPVEAYGLSDAGMLLWSPVDRQDRPPGSCGLPTVGFECRLVDENDVEVPVGEVGELVARPTLPGVMSAGYWGMDGATVESRRNLWMHTGDLLRRDPAGWFYFVDRAKDAMRRRGENVSSFEVEQVILTMPGVLDCAVYGVPSDVGEDDIAAAIIPEPDVEVVLADLIRAVGERLPSFAVPRYIRLVDALPRTETQKIKKAELRTQGITSDMWDAARRSD